MLLVMLPDVHDRVVITAEGYRIQAKFSQLSVQSSTLCDLPEALKILPIKNLISCGWLKLDFSALSGLPPNYSYKVYLQHSLKLVIGSSPLSYTAIGINTNYCV